MTTDQAERINQQAAYIRELTGNIELAKEIGRKIAASILSPIRNIAMRPHIVVDNFVVDDTLLPGTQERITNFCQQLVSEAVAHHEKRLADFN